ncbi:virulence factor TspB C-terminal domain-related protein [Neisseria dentiae]|uniref:virulence factor TspB C-terminal domain-related protein n=1 Tax=Neisseria dentiae TaxID=194197 RepID=UPI00359F13A8
MMKNESRNNVPYRHIALPVGLFGILSFIPLKIWADVPTPPPAYHKQIDTSFPSGQKLIDQGYNPNTGVLKVEPRKQGSATVTSNGQTVTGSQKVDVVVTDKYGNKVRVPSRITQTANAAIIAGAVGSAVSNAVEKYSEELGGAIKQGDYGGAAHYSVMTAGAALDNILGGSISGIARGIGRGLGTLPSENGGSEIGTPSIGGNSSPSTGMPTSAGSSSTPFVGGGTDLGAGLRKSAADAAAAQSAAEKRGDVGGALGAAAVGKAAGAAENAANAAKFDETISNARAKGNNVYRLSIYKPPENKWTSLGVYTDARLDLYGSDSQAIGYYEDGQFKYATGGANLFGYLPGSVSFDASKKTSPNQVIHNNVLVEYQLFKGVKSSESEAGLSVRDMTLTAEEIKQILQRMFASQQTNHQEMMRQLSQIAANTAPNTSTSTETTPPSTTGSQVIRNSGSVVDAATTSSSVQGNTVTSAPYTPAGSTQAQQTQVTLNSDGTISTSIVPRPDLAPHSSQAPTRQEIPAPSQNNQTNQAGQSQQTGQQGESTQTTSSGTQSQPAQNQQQSDFCRENPSSAACADLGNADYEDLSLPENAIDLNFSPADIFQTDGVCPEPKSVDLGALGVVEFSYQPICDFAAAIRPVLIAATIMMCAWFVYGFAGEL